MKPAKMVNQHKTTAWNVALWVAQGLVAASLIWAAWMKLFQPIDQLAAMWPWTADHVLLVKLTGIVDGVGSVGLILPAWLRIRPQLTPIAAGCIIVLMICASTFHMLRGEASAIGPNIVFAGIAAFVAWGRVKKAPITPT